MQIHLKAASPNTLKSSCLVVAVHEKNKLSATAAILDKVSAGYISKILKHGDLDGKVGSSLLLQQVPGIAATRVLLLGCGKNELSPSQFSKLYSTMASALQNSGCSDADSYLSELQVEGRDLHWKVCAAIQAANSQSYKFEQFKSKDSQTIKGLKKLSLVLNDKSELKIANKALLIGQATSSGMELTRDLANLPGNICNPSYLAKQAKQLAKIYPAISTKIIEQAQMEKLGMGCLLSVTIGSEQAPKLIVMEYTGASNQKQKPVVLVGKGVTFDSGGISLKPGAGMDEMKYDMGGAASVFGAIKACAEMKLPTNVVAVMPCVENMPSGKASRPGDVVKSMAGLSVEILNTDAEGRLILADALTYAERFNPEVVIDIATLTGACIIALGDQASGLMSKDDELADALYAAGQQSGDRCWRLPLWDEYQDQLKSNFADMANIGNRSAGSVVAGCFLARFTKKYRWAHLDVAGTAWASGAKKGASGRPVPLLVQYLINHVGLNKIG